MFISAVLTRREMDTFVRVSFPCVRDCPLMFSISTAAMAGAVQDDREKKTAASEDTTAPEGTTISHPGVTMQC